MNAGEAFAANALYDAALEAALGIEAEEEQP